MAGSSDRVLDFARAEHLEHTAFVLGDAAWHSGPGWYYFDDEYADEGSVGPFDTREEAIAHAALAME